MDKNMQVTSCSNTLFVVIYCIGGNKLVSTTLCRQPYLMVKLSIVFCLESTYFL